MNSNSGAYLTKFGRAHCQIATLQEAYAVTLTDTYLQFLKRSTAELSDFTTLRKKLDSRRLAYDAAITKAEKTYKKEKDKKEAEDELQAAKLRYDETCEDVRTRMDAIKDSEEIQSQELDQFLGLEIKFVEQYLSTLMELRDSGLNGCAFPLFNYIYSFLFLTSRGRALYNSTTTRSKLRLGDTITTTSATDLQEDGTPDERPKIATTPSHASTSSFSRLNILRPLRSPHTKKKAEADEQGDQADEQPKSPESAKVRRQKSQSSTKRERSNSKSSKRRPSSAAATVIGDDDDRITEAAERSKRRMSVAGWVGSIGSKGKHLDKEKDQDKSNFSTLQDYDTEGSGDEGHSVRSRTRSLRSNRSASSFRSKFSRSNSKVNVGSAKHKGNKTVRATEDFDGSVDELSFKAGDVIVVVNEVLDEWWLGELNGRTGLFPTSHIELVESNPTAVKPKRSSTPSGQHSSSYVAALGLSHSNASRADEDESRVSLMKTQDLEPATSEDEFTQSDSGDEPTFGAHRVSSKPASLEGGGFYPESLTSTDDDDHEYHNHALSKPILPPRPVPVVDTSTSSSNEAISLGEVVNANPPSMANQGTKRIPPPPPPRNKSEISVRPPAPPLPARNMSTLAVRVDPPPLPSRSTSTLGSSAPSFASAADRSPFLSNAELASDVAQQMTAGQQACRICGCTQYAQNPFQRGMMCSACEHQH